MAYQAGLAQLAALLADPAREAMVSALMSGDALSAGELASAAALSPQSASAHLRRLLEGGILSVKIEGRQRRFRIADAQVAAAIEALADLAARLAADRVRHAPPAVRRGRQCYDHLAGALGVKLAEALAQRGYLQTVDGRVIITEAGSSWFGQAFPDLNIGDGRGQLRLCPDWTEGQPHLAGSLARQMLYRLVAQGQLVRHGRSRTVSLTAKGRLWFGGLGIPMP